MFTKSCFVFPKQFKMKIRKKELEKALCQRGLLRPQGAQLFCGMHQTDHGERLVLTRKGMAVTSDRSGRRPFYIVACGELL
jgi:hypothetical protein